MSARTVAERINEAAGSAFWPLATGVVGGVWSGQIRLRYRSSLFEYNAKPVLSGRVLDMPNGSRLELRYRAPVWVYGFYIVWYLLLTVIIAALIGSGWAPQVTMGDKWMTIGVFVLLLVAPIGLHAFGTRHSEEEFDDIVDFLAQRVQANR